MKVIDLRSTEAMGRAIAWSRWPRTLIKHISSGTLVGAMAIACLLCVEPSGSTATRPSRENTSKSLNDALNDCRRIIETIRLEMSDADGTRQADIHKTAQPDPHNWRVDSAGRHWTYNAELTKWVMTP